jgi:hypothetical protein
MKYTECVCTNGHIFLYPSEKPPQLVCPVWNCFGDILRTSLVQVNKYNLKHGTDSSYVHGCRCDDCRTAHTLAEAARRQAARDRESVRQSYRS